MNQHTLTQREAATLFRLIAYGRGTASNMARVLDLDRRTCQRLTSQAALADIVAKLDAKRLDIREWYALLFPRYHKWGGGHKATSGWHCEAQAARDLRGELSIIAVEMIGDTMRERMVEAWTRDKGKRPTTPRELRKALMRDIRNIPSMVEMFYHFPQPSPASFTDANGDPL